MRDIMGDPYEFEAMGDEFIPFFIELNHPFVVNTRGDLVEGYVSNPKVWIEILVHLLGRSELGIKKKEMYSMKRKVATGLGPFIKCLQNDMKPRRFFGSKHNWHDAWKSFAGLLTHLVGIRGMEDYSPEIIPIVMEYDGLVEMLIRCMFWEELRPAIIKEFIREHDDEEFRRGHFDIALIENYAASVIEQIMLLGEMQDNPVAVYYTGTGYDINMKVCNTIIVSQAFDSLYNVTAPIGILGLLEGSMHNAALDSSHWSASTKSSMWNIMIALGVTGCVSDDIYKALVAVGYRTYLSFEDATSVMNLAMVMANVFTPDAAQKPIDSRVAMAIDAGMLELILNLLTRFKSRNGTSLFTNHIGMFLQAAISVSQYEKCTRALAERNDSIAAALKKYDNDPHPPHSNVAMKYNDIRSMIESIYLNQQAHSEDVKVTCFDCSLVSEEDEELCQQCNELCYCVNDCETEHWKSDYLEDACSDMPRRGRLTKVAQNTLKLAKKVLNDETRSQILVNATLMDLDILDCIVLIDLTVPPMVVEVKESDMEESEYAKKNSNLMIVISQRDRESPLTQPEPGWNADKGGSCSVGGITKALSYANYDPFFYHKITWPEAQETLRDHFAGRMDELRENPDLGSQYLESYRDIYTFEHFEELLRTSVPDFDETSRHELVEELMYYQKNGKYRDPTYDGMFDELGEKWGFGKNVSSEVGDEELQQHVEGDNHGEDLSIDMAASTKGRDDVTAFFNLIDCQRGDILGTARKFKDGKYMPLTDDDYNQIALIAPRVTFHVFEMTMSEEVGPFTFNAPNGKWFSVRQLAEALSEAEASMKYSRYKYFDGMARHKNVHSFIPLWGSYLEYLWRNEEKGRGDPPEKDKPALQRMKDKVARLERI